MNIKCFTESIPVTNNQSGIYIIYVAQHKYVGSTKNFYKRLQTHRKELRRGIKENQKFLNAYKKYGESACFWEILEICDPIDKILKEREEYWINQMQADLNINKSPTQFPTTIINNLKSTSKPIYQYSLLGEFINEFPSCSEASRMLHIDNNAIAQAGRKAHSYNKSAGGYQWSYIKCTNIGPYINNSSKAKIIPICLFDCFTGEEYCFTSIAEAVRILNIVGKNFDSTCAAISSASKKVQYLNNRYLVRKPENLYKIPTRNKQIIDTRTNTVYGNIKSAHIILNFPKQTLKKILQSNTHEYLHYLNDVASVKFRESGKLHLLDNPNPSNSEMN